MTDGALHPSAARVAEALRARGVRGAVLEFAQPTRTAKEAAAALGCELGAIASCLVFVLDDQPCVVITSGAHRVDTAFLAGQLGAHALRTATAEEVRAATGQPIGGVAPVNWPGTIRVVLDRALQAHDQVWAAAGTPHAVFPTTFEELRDLTGAEVRDVARGAASGGDATPR